MRPHYYSIELHQIDTQLWVGIVKDRGARQSLKFMSGYHSLSLFAFQECFEWVSERTGAGPESFERGEADTCPGAGQVTHLPNRLAC